MGNLKTRLESGCLLMDGAMGTSIQAQDIKEADWQGHAGCNEFLNLSRPDIIESIHRSYLEAGSDVIETNTFGAAPTTLDDYGLAEKCKEVNRIGAECAREAAREYANTDRHRYVFGTMGPGTKLASLGQTDFDTLRSGYSTQIEGLLEGGADGIMLETCQDILQVKAGICAFEDVTADQADIPLYVSVTIEDTGTMLVGSSIEAVVSILAPFPVDILGMNCATGPKAMRRHLRYLNEQWPAATAAMPNAGLPEMIGGEVHYPLGPDEFADIMNDLVRDVNLNVIGGCCGTGPDHIARLHEVLKDYEPDSGAEGAPNKAASLYSPVDLTQEPPPLLIGERGNATGSRKFREALQSGDYDQAFSILAAQEREGAHMLDLNCAYAGSDEKEDIRTLVSRTARESRLPLVIDSTDPEVMETALKLYGGRAFVNSINLEEGEEKATRVARLAKRYGCGLIGLTIDEEGMAKTARRKVDVAKQLVGFCEQYGIQRESLMIDTLTFTVTSGDETLQTAAIETLEAIRRIKAEIPGVRTLLGVSNISFGLKSKARKVVNAVFLDMAVKAGLDAAIFNVAQIIPLNSIEPEAAELARDLLENNREDGDPLLQLIGFFEENQGLDESREEENISDEELIEQDVVNGRMVGEDLIERLLENHAAEDVLNGMLVPGMAEVGRLFNDGTLQLPFVLKSAEVMKKTVDMLKPHMQHEESGQSRGKMVLATVAGDVHDIGKNLVDIILSNNGFDVVNLGTKIPAEDLAAAVEEHRPDAIGMSGLLVKSTAVMARNLELLRERGVDVPVFLGGAALTPDFVAKECQPKYSGKCVYCADAFAGLEHLSAYMENGGLPEVDSRPASDRNSGNETYTGEAVENPDPIPEPPFYGYDTTAGIDLEEVYQHLNMRALIRGRWGYRKGEKSDAEYQQLLDEEVYPKFNELKEYYRNGRGLDPKVAWGYFPCKANDTVLTVQGPDGDIDMRFPRSPKPPHHAIPDYFDRDRDVVAFMVVTMGESYIEECERLKKADEYQRYYLFHGLAAELTEALASYWHSCIRADLGFMDPAGMKAEDLFKGRYRGERYSFGYSSCPDTRMNKVVCDLVHAHEIGVSTTESGMMTPEVSTAALITHNSAKTD